MNNFQRISRILREQEAIETTADIKNNPKLLSIKKKAEEIRTKAELVRAGNQMTQAQLDQERIKTKAAEQQAQAKKKQTIAIAHQQASKDQNLDSGNPINVPQQSQENVSEDILEPSNTKTSINEIEDNDREKLPDGEDETEDDEEEPQPPQENPQTSDEELSQVPGEEQPQQEEPQVDVEIAGSKPTSKEEADIARIQAQTREIQAKIGEYTPPGAAQMSQDPMAAQDGMDPNMMGGAIDPTTGMPMMGQPQNQKPDPLKGLGDTTDPQAAMGMMGGMGGMNINPMTGMPEEPQPSKTPSAIGRLYLLKKIYYRLALLDKILSNSPDTELFEVAKITSEAFQIYRIIIQNMKCYKEKIDEIIVDYYILIRDIAQHVETHFKQQSLSELE